jgi:hypothetical protein
VLGEIGGSIELEENEGKKGTTFIITIIPAGRKT